MLSRKVLDALRDEFNDEFGDLSEKDSYICQMKADAFALISSMAPNDKRLECEVDDAITGIVSASSLLGFYIGLKTGANMMSSLTSNNFPQKYLAAFGELIE